MGRKANGEATIYQGSDGWWHGRVVVGIRDDGSPDRRHRMGRTEAEVRAKIDQLKRDRDQGRTSRVGMRTVGQWLEHWLENISRPSVGVRSYEAYRTAVNVHLTPGNREAPVRSSRA